MVRCYALLGSVVLWASCIAQESPLFDLQRYGPEHGLSNRHVTALLQDEVGYIWVGSVSGLDRFDGHGFRSWTVIDGLSGGRVDALRRDTEGKIWVFSTKPTDDIATIDVLDPTTGKLQPLARHAPDPRLAAERVLRVAPRRNDGAVVLGTGSPAGCVIYRGRSDVRFLETEGERFEPLGSDPRGMVLGHLVDDTGMGSIVRVDTSGKWETLRPLERGTVVRPLTTGRSTPGALYVTIDPSGEHRYYDTYSEFFLDHSERASMVNEGMYDPVSRPVNITAFMRRPMRMEAGRILDRNNTVLFDLATHHPEVAGRLKDCILDQGDEPWMATEFGLFRIRIRGDLFRRSLFQEHIPAGTGIVVRGMAWHQEKLYVSTEWDGAYTLSTVHGKVTPESQAGPRFLFAGHVSAKGTWWRGGAEMVFRQDSDGQTREYQVPGKIWSILDDDAGLVMLGGVEGLYRLDPKTGESARSSDPAYPELDQALVLQMVEEGPNTLRATTSKGLYRLDKTGKVLVRWWSGAEGRERIPYDDLHHCHIDADGIFWLSTRGAGLLRFDPRSGDAETYSTRNGFANNMVYAAYEDADGQLWCPTDGGIVRFHKQSGQSAMFTTIDGITHNEFNRLAHAQAPDGRLFFGGLNGITMVDPKDFRNQTTSSQVPFVFTTIDARAMDERTLLDHSDLCLSGQPLELRSGNNSAEVSFALLSYEGTGRILYAWRIAGVDDEWTYQYAANLRLDRLPEGGHVLEVRARDGMGRWHDRILRLPISVQGNGLASRWGWITLGVSITLLTLVLVRWHFRRARSLDRSVVLAP